MKAYRNFTKSLANLEEGARKNPPYSILEETGMVALFSLCFEQSWKVMKAYLEAHGRIVNAVSSPRGIIKIAYQCSMLHDEESWLNLLKTRNLLTHTYSDDDLPEIIERIRFEYVPLFAKLRQELEERWISEE